MEDSEPISELTPMIFNIGLTHLGSEGSIHYTHVCIYYSPNIVGDITTHVSLIHQKYIMCETLKDTEYHIENLEYNVTLV